MADDRFQCTACGKSYRWKQEIAGRKVKCKCGHIMVVPEVLSSKEDSMSYELDFDSHKEPAAPASTRPAGPCPSCGADMPAGAVVCMSCGFNTQTGEALETSVGKAVKTGSGLRRQVYSGTTDGFFGKISRGWEFAKISYGILWDHKQLVVFPIFSGVALLIVLASFLLPMWSMGTLDELNAFLDDDTGSNEVSPLTYALAFIFYFVNYFVIIFFNTALSACAMKVCAGEAPTIGYGLSIAVKRLPQIVGWALLSATVGLILKMIENANEKVGAIVAAIIGTAWTVLTYFVVPVLVVEGTGPFKSVGQSVKTLKDTWGEAVMGNFSMGLITFLVALPLYLIFGVICFLGISGGSIILVVLGAIGFVASILIVAVISSASDVVFRSLLYNFATGRTIPEEVDESMFEAAFAGKA